MAERQIGNAIQSSQSPTAPLERMGYDLTLTRAPIEPIAAVLAIMRRQGFHVSHTARGIRPTSPTSRQTSAGARGALAPALATPARAAASWCAASWAGRSF